MDLRGCYTYPALEAFSRRLSVGDLGRLFLCCDGRKADQKPCEIHTAKWRENRAVCGLQSMQSVAGIFPDGKESLFLVTFCIVLEGLADDMAFGYALLSRGGFGYGIVAAFAASFIHSELVVHDSVVFVCSAGQTVHICAGAVIKQAVDRKSVV